LSIEIDNKRKLSNYIIVVVIDTRWRTGYRIWTSVKTDLSFLINFQR